MGRGGWGVGGGESKWTQSQEQVCQRKQVAVEEGDMGEDTTGSGLTGFLWPHVDSVRCTMSTARWAVTVNTTESTSPG